MGAATGPPEAKPAPQPAAPFPTANFRHAQQGE